jgi:hypothetical protein
MKTKLHAYAAMSSAALLTISAAEAQTVHFNIDPDKFIGGDLDYYIDLNDDGINEMAFSPDFWSTFTYWGGEGSGSSSMYVQILNFANIVESGGRAALLASGDIIDDSKPFTTGNLPVMSWDYDSHGSAGDLDMHTGSSWINKEGFLGLKFNIDGNTHFGWLRLVMYSEGEGSKPWLILKDFAYNATPNEGIVTQFMEAATVSELFLEDVSDTDTPADLQLSFNKAPDESTVSAYRVILDKNYPYTTLAEANVLTPEKYTEIIPNGDDVTLQFSEITLDADGDPIEHEINYTALVLSVADGINVTSNQISFKSNKADYTLMDATPASSASLYVTGADSTIYSMHTGYNMYGEDVDSMYAFICEAEDLTLDSLLSLNENYFTVDYPDYGSNTVYFSADHLIYPGEIPKLFSTYYGYQITFPDGIASTSISLTVTPQRMFVYPYSSSVPQITNSGLTGNPSDIHVNFPKFYDESKIESYIIVVVKEGFILTNTEVATLSANSKYVVNPNGENISVDLPSNMRDKIGMPIGLDESYQVYVVLKSAGDIEYYNRSANSESFVLSEPLSIENELDLGQLFFAEQVLYIDFPELTAGKLLVYNTNGQIVKYQELNANETKVALTDLPDGVYTAIYSTENGYSSCKFILTK